MNKRIRELNEQATYFKEGLTEGLYDIEIFDKEKFAELIVKECADWTNENVGLITPEARKDLYKHFGVEE
jgi:hypothetical protein